MARNSACSASRRFFHGPAMSRPSRVRAPSNRLRLAARACRGTSVPQISPTNVAKSRATTSTSVGANDAKRSSAWFVRALDHVRYRMRWPLLASTAFQSTVVLPEPGRPRIRQTGRSSSTSRICASVQGRPAMSSFRSSGAVGRHRRMQPDAVTQAAEMQFVRPCKAIGIERQQGSCARPRRRTGRAHATAFHAVMLARPWPRRSGRLLPDHYLSAPEVE